MDSEKNSAEKEVSMIRERAKELRGSLGSAKGNLNLIYSMEVLRRDDTHYVEPVDGLFTSALALGRDNSTMELSEQDILARLPQEATLGCERSPSFKRLLLKIVEESSELQRLDVRAQELGSSIWE